MDPRTDSDLSKQQGSHSGDHHYGRDAALTGAGNAGLRKVEKHHRGNDPNLATSSNTSGKGGQSFEGSGIDPRVDSTRSDTARDESAVPSTGTGHWLATNSDHHYKRDAGVAGAGSIGTYEVEKHLGSSSHSEIAATPQDRVAGSGQQAAIANGSSLNPSSSYGVASQSITHHTEREPLGAGGVGTGATGGVNEAQKLREYGGIDPGTQVREHQHPGASIGTYPPPGYGNDTEKAHHTGHHTGRDAALAGGAGAGVGALAGHEYSQKDAGGYGKESNQDTTRGHQTGIAAAVVGGAGPEPSYGKEPYDETSRGHHTHRDNEAVAGVGAGSGTFPSHKHSQKDTTGYNPEPPQDSRKHHTARDAAILGGAAGGGGFAGHEYSKKDAEKLQKEHDKEEKALEKEHSKEFKQHNKEIAREEKANEKAIEKSEKKHEKLIEKDEKKQEHGEKKHGGLLGFLHRDRPDKELKEEEAARQAATHSSRGEEEMATDAGATGLESRSGYNPFQGEHGSQSGVHDTPIGIGYGPTTHDAYGTHDSGHNKLHKDPPPKVLESRGYEFH